MTAGKDEAQPAAVAPSLLGLISLPAFFAVLIWSGIAPFGKYALDDFPTLAFVALRALIATVVIFLLLRARRLPIGIDRVDLPRVLIAGIGLLAVSQLFFMGGLDRTSVAHLIILASTSPLIAAVIRWTRRGERPDPRSAVALLLGFAGVLIVVGDAGSTEGTSVLGDLMALGAAATWVGMTVYPQPLVVKYGAVRATGWLMLAAALALVPVSVFSIASTMQTPPPPLAWASLLYTALGMLAGNTLWQKAVQQVGPARTLIYLYLEPFLALLIAAVVLGDRMTLMQAVGGILAIAGVMLVRKE